MVTRIRQPPLFGQLQAVPQLAADDAVITGSMPVPTSAMATVGIPTFVMRGGRTWPQLTTAVEHLAGMLPHARLQIGEPGADCQTGACACASPCGVGDVPPLT